MEIKPFKSYIPHKRIFGNVPIGNPNLKYYNHPPQWSFLEVIKSESPKAKFEEFVDQDFLVQNPNPSFYIYQQVKNEIKYTGLICLINSKELKSKTILPHEEILEKRSSKLANYLKKNNIQAEPVNIVCKNKALEDELEKHTAKKPFESFYSDGTFHSFWVLPEEENEKLIGLGKECIDPMIADGHHRISATLKNHLEDSSNTPYVLAFLGTKTNIKIFPYHREFETTKRQKQKILDFLIEKSFKEIMEIPNHLSENEVMFQIDGRFYIKNVALFGKETIYYLLNLRIFDPIMNIHNIKKSERIYFIPGERDMLSLSKIDLPENKVRVFMPALSYDRILSLAKEGVTLPPKSSWILPKLMTGLNVFDGNVD